jgi:hypothetical protein
MRLFHFVEKRWGLDDIRRRRLKIATIGELNDPFELLAADLRHPALRAALLDAKKEFAKSRGFLCFSRSWQNPVQWSHYSAKHTGLCLGFDIPDGADLVRPVEYSAKRFVVDVAQLATTINPDPTLFGRFLFTKYSHWRYEKEMRAMAHLDKRDGQFYFTSFSESLRLACVIVGARSQVTRAMLRQALGDLAPYVETFKARLAFRSFKVVRQRRATLWS